MLEFATLRKQPTAITSPNASPNKYYKNRKSCILAVALVSIGWLGRLTVAQYALVGAFWLLLTLAFEFGFGLLRGQSLAALLDAYRFKDGNIWPIVLAVTAAAPLFAAYLRGLVR